MTAIDFSGKIHPFIEDLPIFEDKVDEIAESIDEVGLLHPVTLDQEGQVIGGRHRLTACEVAGVDPTFEVWDGDPLAFMLHDNDARKHQTTGQLAAEKAITLSRAGFRNGGRWKRGTTSYLKNSNNDNSSAAEMLSHAGVILDILGEKPLQEIASGLAKFSEVQAEAKAEKERQENAERRKIEAAKAEEEREAYATEYFANHPAAREWLDSKPEGVFETARAAFAAYQEHDREARAIEEARRREEEEARRAQRDRIERMGRYLEAFVSNFQTGLDMADHPERDAILDTLTPQKRSDFLNIENTYLKGNPE